MTDKEGNNIGLHRRLASTPFIDPKGAPLTKGHVQINSIVTNSIRLIEILCKWFIQLIQPLTNTTTAEVCVQIDEITTNLIHNQLIGLVQLPVGTSTYATRGLGPQVASP